jgi:hypothetical protein
MKHQSALELFFTRRAIVLLALALSLLANPAAAQDKKLKLEEVLAKHLDAIGAAEARAAASRRVVSGTVKVVNRLGTSGSGQSIAGDAMLVTSGKKLRFGMNIPSLDYPGEQLAFNGEKATTGALPNGRLSQLSQFLRQQDLPLREGLLAGALSVGWPLLRLDQTQPRLEYRGLKKVAGKQLHELSYRPRKGSTDLEVKLYFEAETFRHVQTDYRFQIGARPGTINEEIRRQDESYYLLTEEFDDFRAIDGLTLPHKYKLQISVQTATGTLLADWLLAVTSSSHKQDFSEEIFTIK